MEYNEVVVVVDEVVLGVPELAAVSTTDWIPGDAE